MKLPSSGIWGEGMLSRTPAGFTCHPRMGSQPARPTWGSGGSAQGVGSTWGEASARSRKGMVGDLAYAEGLT